MSEIFIYLIVILIGGSGHVYPMNDWDECQRMAKARRMSVVVEHVRCIAIDDEPGLLAPGEMP